MGLFDGPKGTQPQQVQPLKDYTPDFETLGNQLAQLNRTMQQFFQTGQAKESRYSLHTFDAGAITFDSHGYRYTGMFVAAAQTLTVTLSGLSYSLSLMPGLNRLNLVDGTQLASSVPFAYVLYYSDYPFAEDSEGVAVTGTANVQVVASSIMQPVDIQNHLQTTIQTQNAVSVGASNGTSTSSWIDTNGYQEIGVIFKNDAATSSSAILNWSVDQSGPQGQETLIASSNQTSKAGSTPTKARYVQVVLMNGDTVAHTMSAWAYLKA